MEMKLIPMGRLPNDLPLMGHLMPHDNDSRLAQRKRQLHGAPLAERQWRERQLSRGAPLARRPAGPWVYRVILDTRLRESHPQTSSSRRETYSCNLASP